MFKSTLFFAKAAVLATAILAMSAGESLAQRGGHGGGGHGGGGHGGGGHMGGGRGFGGGFGGRGFGGRGFGGYGGWGYGGWGYGGYGLGYGGWGYGYPYYGYGGGYYDYPSYDYGGYYGGYAPTYSYATPYYSSSAAMAPSTTYQSYYPAGAATSATNANAAMIEVALPSADAQVWFNDTKTTQSGTVRRYSSPPLTPGQSYTYTIRASWTANGQPVTQTKEIQVQAGQSVVANFTQ